MYSNLLLAVCGLLAYPYVFGADNQPKLLKLQSDFLICGTNNYDIWVWKKSDASDIDVCKLLSLPDSASDWESDVIHFVPYDSSGNERYILTKFLIAIMNLCREPPNSAIVKNSDEENNIASAVIVDEKGDGPFISIDIKMIEDPSRVIYFQYYGAEFKFKPRFINDPITKKHYILIRCV